MNIEKSKMIAAIRIKGLVKVNREFQNTMYMLRLRKKNVCVLFENKPEILGMLKNVEGYIAYGEIDKETLKQLLEKRAKPKIKIDDAKINELFEGKIKIKDLKIKLFFSLHPPLGGFKKSTKLPWPKGILGNQGKEINKLIIRML